MFRKILMAGAAIFAAASLSACGAAVQPGNEGIMVNNFGANAGVQEKPLGVGYHFTAIGSHIIEYPTITRNYSWAQKGDGDKKDVNEELVFADSTGLPLSADVQVTLSTDPTKVADIYKRYRLDFEDLLDGPVKAQVRTSIATEASKFGASDMFSASRATVIQRALADVQKHFEGTGVIVSDLQWLGNIRAPQSVLDSIRQRTQVEQQTQIALANVSRAEAAAKAQVAQAQGNSDARVAEAKGEAEALRVRGEAIRANPEVLKQEWIRKWSGQLPQYMLGSTTTTMMFSPNKD